MKVKPAMKTKLVALLVLSNLAFFVDAAPVRVTPPGQGASFGADLSLAASGQNTRPVLAARPVMSRPVQSAPASPGNASSASWVFGALHPHFGALGLPSGGFSASPSSVNLNPVPLPAPFWFLASGLLVVTMVRRRAAKQARLALQSQHI